MAGLNFQTQTIINANVDKDSNNKVLFEAVSTKVDGVDVEAVKIKRDFLFVKDCVKSIRKRAGYEAKMCKATINFGEMDIMPTEDEPKVYCRLDIYLGVEGSEPFIYATPWVQKGMPFWVEFTVTEKNKDKIAEHVADMIKKNHLFLVDKDLLNVTASGNELVLEGATEYQRFRKIEVHKFAAADDYSDRVAELDLYAEDATDVVLDERGLNSFGTYSQIIKDLRLPTAANYQWTHIRQAETPIVGAIYDQFIVEYCAPASNEGLHVVGQREDSHTVHVFWVKNDISAEFEEVLGSVGEITSVDDKAEESTEESTEELN